MVILRYVAQRLLHSPLPIGLLVGLLAIGGVAQPGCALKPIGGCLPGENTPIGQMLWGLAAGAVAVAVLHAFRRLRTPRRDD
jgi:hypothetical protein